MILNINELKKENVFVSSFENEFFVFLKSQSFYEMLLYGQNEEKMRLGKS